MNDLSVLSICTGGGGIELGIQLAGRVLGFNPREILYVEREAFAVAHLDAAIEKGFLADAPVWPDVESLDAKPFAGKVG